jgi:hypothetical protein
MTEYRPGWVYWFWSWVPEDEVRCACKKRMDMLDALPRIVRNAIHEADEYTDPHDAKRLMRRYGAETTASMILKGKRKRQ